MPEDGAPAWSAAARRGYLAARITADGRVAPVGTDSSGSPHPEDGAHGAGRGDDSDGVLVDAIRREIEAAGGRITFARFMELALYHPQRGYYTTSADRPTRSGDFLTAPEVHPVFGRLVARQLTEMWDRLDGPPVFVLAEHGAGRGVLGESILRGLQQDDSRLLAAIRYRPVDLPGRTEMARERIRAAGFEGALEDPGVSDEAPFRGCILANELLDAFPVHRVGRLDGELVEWYVTWADEAFAEQPGEPSTPALAARLSRDAVELREGQRAEVSLSIGQWLAAATTSLEHGYVLLADYGFPARELYGARRPRGTLRAFRRHHASADPFRAVGQQDLTAHVDVTALEHAAADADLHPLGDTTQAEFLIGLGLGELLQQAQGDRDATFERLLAMRTAAARFIDPGALGGFAVVVFGRGVPDDPPLRGLAFRIGR